jgi:hypothetical protein
LESEPSLKRPGRGLTSELTLRSGTDTTIRTEQGQPDPTYQSPPGHNLSLSLSSKVIHPHNLIITQDNPETSAYPFLTLLLKNHSSFFFASVDE